MYVNFECVCVCVCVDSHGVEGRARSCLPYESVNKGSKSSLFLSEIGASRLPEAGVLLPVAANLLLTAVNYFCGDSFDKKCVSSVCLNKSIL